MNVYYVYVLLDPSKNNEPFYVGKGKRWRVKNHYCPSYLRKKCHKSNIIKKYRRFGFEDIFLFLEENLTELESHLKEIQYIEIIGRRCDGTGPLVNRSLGGEGSSGVSVPRTEEWKSNISKAKKGQPFTLSHRENLSKSKLGVILTDEQRKKISKSLKGRIKSPEHLKNISVALQGKRKSKECIEKQCKKVFVVLTPSGDVVKIRNLNQYGKDVGVHPSNFHKTLRGKISHIKGFRLLEVIDDRIS